MVLEHANMLAIVICSVLVGLSAGTDLLYKGIAEKGSATVKPSQTINAYIGDKDCDALIAFPVLPCRPGVLRVSVMDNIPYPDVTIDETLLQAIVRRQSPCNHKASVDIEYECAYTDDQPKLESKEAKLESEEAEDYSSEEFNVRAKEPVRLEPLTHLKHRRYSLYD